MGAIPIIMALALAQQPIAEIPAYKRPELPARLTTPAMALKMACVDIGSVAREDQPFQKWFWFPEVDRDELRAMSWVLNTAVSHNSTIYHPVPVAGGVLLRWDTRRVAPDPVSFARLSKILSGYFDPRFLRREKISTAPYPADDGKTYAYTLSPPRPLLEGLDDFLTLAVTCRLNMDTASGLPTETPIFHAPLFLVRALSTLKANDGIYYDLRGYERNPAKGTAFDAWLARYGASVAKSEELRGLSRTAIFASGVTRKPRAGDILYGVASRPVDGPSIVTLTYDIADGDRKAGQHPLRNLEKFRFRAIEAIAWANRFEYALFDDKGALQDSVPEGVAKDHEIPAPNTNVLQGAVACIRCHGPFDGWQPFPNDVQRITSEYKTPDGNRVVLKIFDDEASKDSVEETLERIASKYQGDLTEPLRLARNASSLWSIKVTGGQTTAQVSATIARVFQREWLDLMTPERAMLDLGYRWRPPLRELSFGELVPLLPPNRHGISPEDPTIHNLRLGGSVIPQDWLTVYPDAATRAYGERLRLRNLRIANPVRN